MATPTKLEQLPEGLRLVLTKRPDHEIARGLVRQTFGVAPSLADTPKTTEGWVAWLQHRDADKPAAPAKAPGAPEPEPRVMLDFLGQGSQESCLTRCGAARFPAEITPGIIDEAVDNAIDEDLFERRDDGMYPPEDVAAALSRYFDWDEMEGSFVDRSVQEESDRSCLTADTEEGEPAVRPSELLRAVSAAFPGRVGGGLIRVME